jgi:hypothetical protein
MQAGLGNVQQVAPQKEWRLKADRVLKYQLGLQ